MRGLNPEKLQVYLVKPAAANAFVVLISLDIIYLVIDIHNYMRFK